MSEELLNAPEQTQEIEQNVENVAENAAPVVEESAPAVEENAPKAPHKKHVIENAYADAMANFDWDKVSEQTDRYSKEEKARLEDLYTKSFKSIEQDDVIKGKVVSIRENYTTQYGNASFTISDDGTNKGTFLVYRALYLGNKKYTFFAFQ